MTKKAKLTIGGVYRITYNMKGTPCEKKNPRLISLKVPEAVKLIKDVVKNAEKSELIYAQCQEAWEPFIKKTKALELIKARKVLNHKRKKLPIEIALESDLKELRKKLFKKSQRVRSPREQARALFIRVLDIDRITFDASQELNDSFHVLYAGKMLTHKGKTVHKFYFLDPQKISLKDIPTITEDYLDITR